MSATPARIVVFIKTINLILYTLNICEYSHVIYVGLVLSVYF